MCFGKSNGQAPFGSFIDYKVLPNLDTLILYRSFGDWWFGIFAEGSYNFNFGSLKIPQRPFLPVNDTFNRVLSFKSNDNFNPTFGLLVEYNPKGSYWGGGLRISLLENRIAKSSFKVDENDSYFPIIDFWAIGVSPRVRYNFAIEGLYAFAGLDFEILFNDKSKLQEQEKKGAETIYTDWVLPAKVQSLRYGFSLGAGWDLLFLDIAQLVRAHWTPYISIQYGTPFFKGYSSNLNSFSVRAGVALKFGPDDVTKQLKPYDSTYVPPAGAIAIAQPVERRSVQFRGFERQQMLASLEISVVSFSEILQNVGLTEEERIESEISVPKQREAISIRPDQKIVLRGYLRTDNVGLTPDMRNTLDALADFMIQNPEYSLVIEGHSDNQGTPTQNLERSQQRALAVVNYLVARKVPQSRIRWAGRSSFYPIADNRTEEGRRQNRRVEIQIIK